jgi:hypothetical protein
MYTYCDVPAFDPPPVLPELPPELPEDPPLELPPGCELDVPLPLPLAGGVAPAGVVGEEVAVLLPVVALFIPLPPQAMRLNKRRDAKGTW